MYPSLEHHYPKNSLSLFLHSIKEGSVISFPNKFFKFMDVDLPGHSNWAKLSSTECASSLAIILASSNEVRVPTSQEIVEITSSHSSYFHSMRSSFLFQDNTTKNDTSKVTVVLPFVKNLSENIKKFYIALTSTSTYYKKEWFIKYRVRLAQWFI